MTKLVGIAFLFLVFQVSGQVNSDDIRFRFENAKTEADFEWIVNVSTKYNSSNDSNIVSSYKAVSKSALAQYVFSPYTKIKYFFAGKNELEKCISYEKNLENVFLRLVVQLSIPAFLGYSDDIEDDLIYLRSNIKKYDVSLAYKTFIVQTLINTENSNYDLESLLELDLNEI